MFITTHSMTFFSAWPHAELGAAHDQIRLDLPAVGRPLDRSRSVLGVALRRAGIDPPS
jgi:hypothetical protein